MKKQKGITLVALIITIIIMLILVAVSVNVIIKSNLIGTAEKTANGYKAAQDRESNGTITINGKEYGSVDDYISGNEYIKSNIAGGTRVTTNTEYTIEGETRTAEIPAGFTVSGIYSERTIEKGLVIYDIPEGTTVDWTKPDTVKTAYNQFVWIPVEKAIITADEIATLKTEYNATTDTEAIKALANDKGIFPMAVEVVEEENGNEVTNYKGILYEFEGTTKLTVGKVYNWTDSSEQIEPANVSKDNTTRLGSTWNDKTFQNEYNTMIKSVKDNGGFYVGRYEMSVGSYDDGTEYAQSKGETNSITSPDCFFMYKCEKNYAECNSNLGVISEMIWGSQWDQMMVFVNGKNDGRTIPQSFYITESGSRAAQREYGIGVNEADRVANIFDLEASYNEWTQEAVSTTGRTYRGGNRYSHNKASARKTYMIDPTYQAGDYGSSRIALYIK